METNTENTVESTTSESQKDKKLFENFNQITVGESIGTTFLGVLSVLLLVALLRSWKRYEALLEKMGFEK